MAQKNNERGFVRCVECKHATYMQWFENPIIAECQVHHERMVGEARRICKSFEPSGVVDVSQISIQHFDHYDI
ncbi:MAG: hypothetical protein IJT75_07040 [Bacteroidaceae bacterium]|nr:hypothetical protein [Bacteroidaceae bacterium]